MAALRQVSWGLILIVLVTLAGCSGSGTGESDPVMVTVSGRVVDSRGDPVSGATVTIDGVPTATPTDENGEFSGEVEPGDHELTITKGPDTIAAIPISVPESGPGELGEITPTISYFPWYEDNDADGFGNATVIVNDENQPIDYVINDDDCDDTAAAVYPGATEVCDGLDNNCNVDIDEGVLLAFYQDADTDGYGNQSAESLSCSAPVGYVSDSNDCDDTNVAVNPIAPEVCDGLDNNCNVEIDEGVLELFFADADSDTYGNAQSSIGACSAPSGYVLDDSDCDDSTAEINPGATEICNSVDDNCDAVVDEGLLSTFYQDSDVDGFGNWLVSQQSCSAPGGYVLDDTDCDDTAASINPGAPEVCNDIDDNCNVQVDEGVSITFYRDADEDTYGSTTNSIEACTNPAGYLTDNTDCDDAEPGLNPETVWYPDGDQDTYPINSNALMQCLSPFGSNVPNYLITLFDCDDSNSLINPGNLEILGNSIDDDCNSGTLDTAAVYNMSDLQGDWKLYGVNAGDYTNDEWNGWMQGTVAFDDKGQLTDYYLEYDDGFIEKDPDISFIRIDSEGIVTLAGDPMFHGAISQDKDMIVATNTDLEGGYTMLILQKAVAAVTLADFEGAWNTNTIVAGDDPSWSGWFRGTVDILDTGTVNFSLDRSDNDQDAGFIRHNLNADGDLENHWNLRSISADRQLVVGRVDYENGFGLEVLTKSGGAFVPGNLEGDWSFHVLSAGDAPEINGWAHGMMHFDNAGTGAVNYQASSDPTSTLSFGALSVDSAGNILSSTNQTFVGTLSNNKDTIVATFTNESGGASMVIALRRDPPPLEIITEESISASAVISPAVGGSLQVTASDGTRFDLTIPPDAIDSDQDVLIKMTPVAGLGGLPISSNFLSAVQLAPAGLQLSSTGVLGVNLPTPVPLTDLVSYAYQGSGGRFHFLPVLPDAGTTSTATFDIPLWHFGGSGGGTGNVANTGSVPLDPNDAGDYYESQNAGIVQEEGVRLLDPLNADDQRVIDRFEANFADWFNNSVWGLVTQADTPLQVRQALNEYLRWAAAIERIAATYDIWGEPAANLAEKIAAKHQIWGQPAPDSDGWAGEVPLVFPDDPDQVGTELANNINTHLQELQNACATTSGQEFEYIDPCGNGRRLINEALPWIEMSVDLNERGFPTNFKGIDEFCHGLASKLAREMQIRPEGALLNFNDQTSFEAVLISMTGHIMDPVWVSSDSSVASVGDSYETEDGNYAADVRGESDGQAYIEALDEAGCPAGGAWAMVDASGPWWIWIAGRNDDNCHYDEPPDHVPLPVVLDPSQVRLTFDPYLVGPTRHFKLDWYDAVSSMRMTGNTANTPGNAHVKIQGSLVIGGGSLGFSQSCELDFGPTDLEGAQLNGFCEFGKWEVLAGLQSDVCKGKYGVKGRHF